MTAVSTTQMDLYQDDSQDQASLTQAGKHRPMDVQVIIKYVGAVTEEDNYPWL